MPPNQPQPNAAPPIDPNTPTPPTLGELRLWLKESLRQSSNPEMRGYATDQEYLDQRARRTQQQALNLIQSGLRPHEAWDQAITETLLVR